MRRTRQHQTALRPTDRRLVQRRVDGRRTRIALEAIPWPDDELALRYITGFPVAFDIPDSGVFREIDTPAQTSEAEFMATNIALNGSIKQSLSKPPSGAEEVERAKMCWKRTEEEIESGFVFGPVSGAQLDRKYTAEASGGPSNDRPSYKARK